MQCTVPEHLPDGIDLCPEKQGKNMSHLQQESSDVKLRFRNIFCVLLSRNSLLLVSDTSLEFVSLYQVQSAHRSFPSH